MNNRKRGRSNYSLASPKRDNKSLMTSSKDMQKEILMNVYPDDMVSMCLTSKKFKGFCDDKRFQRLYMKKWYPYLLGPNGIVSECWDVWEIFMETIFGLNTTRPLFLRLINAPTNVLTSMMKTLHDAEVLLKGKKLVSFRKDQLVDKFVVSIANNIQISAPDVGGAVVIGINLSNKETLKNFNLFGMLETKTTNVIKTIGVSQKININNPSTFENSLKMFFDIGVFDESNSANVVNYRHKNKTHSSITVKGTTLFLQVDPEYLNGYEMRRLICTLFILGLLSTQSSSTKYKLHLNGGKRTKRKSTKRTKRKSTKRTKRKSRKRSRKRTKRKSRKRSRKRTKHKSRKRSRKRTKRKSRKRTRKR